jgi:adenylate cyclase
VKGKSRAITIYELLGAKKDTRRTEAVEIYEKAFAAYLVRDFDKAIALARPYANDDPPGAVLIERCSVFLREPPPPDWNGVHAPKSK